MRHRIARYLLTGSGLAMVALAVPARAQDAATAPATPAVPAPVANTAPSDQPSPVAQESASAQADSPAPSAEIVVTGSLIQRPNNTAVSPIVTVTNETIKQAGTANVTDVLNQFPGFTPAGNAGTGGAGQGGRATVNLHGLGSNRNLVLLDGRRLPASDINGNVDINILPQVVIGGVDVITGGASAVYGSDAISGVVNFKSVRNLDGLYVDVQHTISQRGDGRRFDASLAGGVAFPDDRGHLIGAFSYTEQDPINGSQRSFFSDKTPSSYIGTGTYVPSALNQPSAATEQAVFARYGVTGTRNPLANLGFNNDGSLFVQNGAVNYRGATNTSGYAIVNGNVRMPVGQQINFLNSLNRKVGYLKGDYELTSSLTAYAQALYVDLKVNTSQGGSITQFGSLTSIPVTNPFIPQDLRTVLASRPNAAAPFTWNGRYVGVPYKNWDENYRVQQYIGGLKGSIASGWTFDVYAGWDSSVHNQTQHYAVLKSKVQTLLNAPDGGASLCAGGFNPFGDANARALSQSCINYLSTDAHSRERLTQTQVQGQINGKLFDLGAGPAQLAIVADYRRNTYNYVPSPDLASQNIEAVIASQAASGRIGVKEVAGQLDIPLLADRPFIRELGVGGAIRYSDYSTTGGVISYEGDARWRPVDILTFRGSYQRAVRAPNIGELFSPASGTQLVIGTPPASLGDPCDARSTARAGANGAKVAALCVAQGVPAAAIASYTFPTTATGQTITGNRGLTPERANTYNVGFVVNPKSIGPVSGISISVDYYNINVKNVISTVPGLTVLSKCYNLDGTNAGYDANINYCRLIQRDATGQIVTVQTPYQNLGGLRTDGIEVQFGAQMRMAFLGATSRLYLNSAIGYLHDYSVQLLPGTVFNNYTNVSNGSATPNSVPSRITPRWKALTTLGYRTDTVDFGARWRYQSGMDDVTSVLTPATAQVGVPSYSLFDLFGSLKVGRQFEVRGGITNLLDKKLPYVASSQNGTDVAVYDSIGRSFYVGFRANF